MAIKRSIWKTDSGRDWRKLLKLLPGYDSVKGARAAGYRFDAPTADRVLDFIEQLRFIEGSVAGEPMVLEEWQQAAVGCLFGWLDKKGLRRYQEMLLYVPRKNGKSPLAAAIADYVLLCDGEPGAQCYIAAADREQATIVYRHAQQMIERHPQLSNIVSAFKSLRSMEFQGSFFRVVTSEAASKHGYNSHLIIVDELHAQPSRELVDVLTSSTGTRNQPLTLFLTTADYDRVSVCNDKYDYATKVRDGVVEDYRFLPVIYDTPTDADWEDEEVWFRANPGLGTIKRLDYMRRECKKAQTELSYQNTFRRLELNQRTESSSAWVPLRRWDACEGETPAEEVLKQQQCWGGLDLSASTDLTSLCLCWPGIDVHGNIRDYLRWWHWIPEGRADIREKTDRVPYKLWRDMGYVEFTPGDVTDYAYIRKKLVKDIIPVYNFADLGSDPWNATHILTQLSDEDGIEVVMFRQGFVTMSAPTKEFERRLLSGQILHDGNPLVKWQISNAMVRMDPAGGVKLDKDKSKHRIDGLVAGVMALGRASVGAVERRKSMYENRGLTVV